MAIVTGLTKRLGLAAPILSAPMAGIGGGALAAAVSGAGGLGLVGGGYGDREWLSRELDVADRAGAGAGAGVGVGFITWALARDPDLLAVALERRPRAIFLSFGDVGPYAPAVARAGVPLVAQVQTVAAAKAAVGEGAVIVVAQGTEAGGHGGERATMALVPAVVDAVGSVPVVAAGGIADGRGLAAALMLGAAGVLCGTAFYATREALAHANAKRAAVEASGDRTVRGSVFDAVRGYDWPAPWRIRTLENAFYRRWASRPDLLAQDISRQRQAYQAAQAAGDVDTAAVIVGEAVDLVRAQEGAAAVVRRIAEEAEARLGSARLWLERSPA
ncbi:nitronate monooxygenase [Arenibaculum sp.]|jgi:nitronate monooxygenase|uniref:NAD(P)H-dependent flavin oxidoreductase n=1 Tax=Arenibaculum sp. TaxID=2865862 RepID=UPI002E114F6C|nr:nitronate monooxygenase [Arenibaculum sp.]